MLTMPVLIADLTLPGVAAPILVAGIIWAFRYAGWISDRIVPVATLIVSAAVGVAAQHYEAHPDALTGLLIGVAMALSSYLHPQLGDPPKKQQRVSTASHTPVAPLPEPVWSDKPQTT